MGDRGTGHRARSARRRRAPAAGLSALLLVAGVAGALVAGVSLPALAVGTGPPPASASQPVVAQPLVGTYTTPLDRPPPGFTRQVSRDGGFSAPTSTDGDVWVFADTDVLDTPDGDPFGAGTVECDTDDGTAAVAPSAVPPSLQEALQPVSAALAAGTTTCSADAPSGLWSSGGQPFQLLGPYSASGETCVNWVNGLTNAQTASGALTDSVVASYDSYCENGAGMITGDLGSWTTTYQAQSPEAQVVRMAPPRSPLRTCRRWTARRPPSPATTAGRTRPAATRASWPTRATTTCTTPF